MREERNIKEYFQEIECQQYDHILTKISDSFQRNNPQRFWQELEDSLINANISRKACFELFVKLMDESAIQSITSTKYEFLLHGKRVKQSLLYRFIRNEQQEHDKMILMGFIRFMRMKHLPEYLIFHNLLIEDPYLSLQDLLKNAKQNNQSLIYSIQAKIRQQRSIDVLDLSIQLSERELTTILQILMPINLCQLEIIERSSLKQQQSLLKDYSKVISFNGQTGVGKSAITLSGLGYNFEVKKDLYGVTQQVPIDVKKQHECIISKSSGTSQTNDVLLVVPNHNFGIDNLLFADMPGRGDSRSTARIFYNNCLERRLYQRCKAMFFIEVLDIQKIQDQRINFLKQYTADIANRYNYQQIEEIQFLTFIFNKCDRSYKLIEDFIITLKQALQYHQESFEEKQRIILRQFFYLLTHDSPNRNVLTVDFQTHKAKIQSFFSSLRLKKFANPKQVVRDIIEIKIQTQIISTLNHFYFYLDQDNPLNVAFFYGQCKELLDYLQLFPSMMQKDDVKRVVNKMNQRQSRYIQDIEGIKRQLSQIIQNIGIRLKDDRQDIIKASDIQTIQQHFGQLRTLSATTGIIFSEEQYLEGIRILIRQEIGNIDLLVGQGLTYSNEDLQNLKKTMKKYRKIKQMKNIFPRLQETYTSFFTASKKYFTSIFDQILINLSFSSRFSQFIVAITQEKEDYLRLLEFTSSILLAMNIQEEKKKKQQFISSLNTVVYHCCQATKSKISYRDHYIPPNLRKIEILFIEFKAILLFIEDLKKIEYFKNLHQLNQLCDQIPHRIRKQIDELKEAIAEQIKGGNKFAFAQYSKKNQMLQELTVFTSDEEAKRQIQEKNAEIAKLCQEGKLRFEDSSKRTSKVFDLPRNILKNTYDFLLSLFIKR